VQIKKIICVNQFLKSQFHEQGVGDCRTCTESTDNAHCKRYQPMTIWRMEAQDAPKQASQETKLEEADKWSQLLSGQFP